MRFIFCLLTFLSLTLSTHADNLYGSISIIAKDCRTGVLVKGGIVWLGDSVKSFSVNENGKCHFDSIIASIYSVKIYAAGYDTFFESSVYIKQSATLILLQI
ncbi:MAG TPA: hypothetical protein VHP36_00545 [Chitinispirillaceae bacterium]|nr:hypothetical protein [Chitinispirillaceae bacterium]